MDPFRSIKKDTDQFIFFREIFLHYILLLLLKMVYNRPACITLFR